ncbi:MAG: hypothetical protein D4R97_02910 [Bacteroidetes bacterium]|nr:MAG: hypothetical protein D4R97_02910 [Bacteroidota bacterium]
MAGFRWVIPVVLVCSFSFMAQKSSPTGKENDKTTFTSIGLTGMIGSYYEELEKISTVWVPGGCETPGYWRNTLNTIGTYQRTFYQGGIDISHNKWVGKYYKYSIGARGFLGFESEGMTADYPSGTSFGVSPYFHFDWRWVGFGAGLTVGQMKLPFGHKDLEKYSAGDIISNDYRNFYIFPSIGFRVGPSDLVYVEARAPALFPSSSPYFAFQAGVGSGLGKTNGTRVGIGYCQGIYAQLVYPIKNKVVLEAFYADNLQTGSNTKRVFSFGIDYRFSFKKTRDTLKYNPAGRYKSLRGFSRLRETVMDNDGNIYHTLALGGQVWMAENLMVKHYRDGSEIVDVTDNASGAGLQYNWSAVNHSMNLCPAGWHVPSLTEWTSLINSLGDKDVAGSKLEKGFSPKGKVSQWWSSTEQDSLHTQSLYLNNQTIGIMFTSSAKTSGFSVRCMRDY